MSDSIHPAPASEPQPRSAQSLDVPVRTRNWLSFIMVPCAVCCALVYVSFAASPYAGDEAGWQFAWYAFALVLAFPLPFMLLARSTHPEAVFWAALCVTIVFPYGDLLMAMALASLLARRRGHDVAAVGAAALAGIWAQLRDALQPANGSYWHEVFARPNVERIGSDVPLLVDEPVIVIVAVVVALATTAIATVSGLWIRSRATMGAVAHEALQANEHLQTLHDDLINQRLADAIAAQAHDGLAHSLSLIAVNANTLQAAASTLEQASDERVREQGRQLAVTAEQIRRQAAGALDEAHEVIDMLRHPEQAWDGLDPDGNESLSRESLGMLLDDVRASGTPIDSWLSIDHASDLDPAVGAAAFHIVQESLTNARRHAPGMPVSLEINANPADGVLIHESNPCAWEGSDQQAPGRPQPSSPHREGAGLASIAARAERAGGSCRSGVDSRGIFHVEATIPWKERA